MKNKTQADFIQLTGPWEHKHKDIVSELQLCNLQVDSEKYPLSWIPTGGTTQKLVTAHYVLQLVPPKMMHCKWAITTVMVASASCSNMEICMPKNSGFQLLI